MAAALLHTATARCAAPSTIRELLALPGMMVQKATQPSADDEAHNELPLHVATCSRLPSLGEAGGEPRAGMLDTLFP